MLGENEQGGAVYQSRAVMEFKAKTEDYFQPINGMNAIEIEELVEEYVTAKLAECDFDAEVRGGEFPEVGAAVWRENALTWMWW